MKAVIRLVLAALVIAYPFVVYFGLLYFEFWQVAAVIIIVALMRLMLVKNQATSHMKIGLVGAVMLVIFAVSALVFQHQIWFKFYPIVISLSLLYFFAASLWTEKSMIQRFAEIREKNITPEKLAYMIKLTQVWCGFFMLNALISSYTLFYCTDKQWMLYNGLISYLLMATLGGGELIYRHGVVMKRLS